MKAAVRNPGRFALNGYLFPDGVPPGSAGNGWQNPSRADAVPGQGVPAPTITASAAHPGRKSNNTIPYTRVTSQDAARVSGKPGYVTFVSRSQSAYAGVGTDRRSLMCGLDLLNQRLRKRDDGRTTMGVGAGDPRLQWKEVRDLDEWRLDGVVLGNPDSSNANPTNDLIDGRMGGTQVLNICVHGIASAVNVFQPDKSKEVRLAPLDEVFVGLFYRRVDGQYFEFQYHAFGVQALRQPRLGLLRGLGNMVGAWRVGKVMDTQAAVGGWGGRTGKSEHRITLNIGIEWIPAWPVAPVHAATVGGDKCFLPTLTQLYGDDDAYDCPDPLLDDEGAGDPVVEEASSAPALAPAPAPADLPSVSDEDEVAFEEPEPPALSGTEGQPPEVVVDRALRSLEGTGGEGTGRLDYRLVSDFTQNMLINDDPETSRLDQVQVSQFSEWNEILLDWTLEHIEVIRYVRREDAVLTPKLKRVKDWVVLQDGIRRALAMRRTV